MCCVDYLGVMGMLFPRTLSGLLLHGSKVVSNGMACLSKTGDPPLWKC